MNKVVLAIENAINTLCNDYDIAKLEMESIKLDLEQEKRAKDICDKKVQTLQENLESGR